MSTALTPELVTAVSGALLDSLRSDLDRKLKEATRSQLEAARPQHEFKSKGLKIQFDLNKEVAADLEDTKELLRSGNAEEALEKLDKAQLALKERRKDLMLADVEDWSVVAAYRSLPLADDEEDDKRLRRAIKAAGKKAPGKIKPDHPANRFQPYTRPGQYAVKYLLQVDPASSSHSSFSVSETPHMFQVSEGSSHRLHKAISDLLAATPTLTRINKLHGCKEPVLSVVPSTISPDSARDGSADPSPLQSPSCHLSDRSDEGKISEASELLLTDKYSNSLFGEKLSLSKLGPSSLRIKGSLRRQFLHWEQLPSSAFIKQVVKEGYVIPLRTRPPPMRFRNNNSAHKHSQFVTKEISALLEAGLIAKVPEPPLVVNPLSVSEEPTKLRLILDCSRLNGFIAKKKVKFEDWRTLIHLLRPGSFFVKFDLKSGYHHVDIHPNSQTLLGFFWQGSYYVFRVLPFGLTSAPRVFTKLMRQLVKYWRARGIFVVIYLDDGIIFGLSREGLLLLVPQLRADLHRLGFTVNEAKSIWDPVPDIEWLGLVWHSDPLSVSIPDRRICRALDCLRREAASHSSTARRVAKITGSVGSMYPVLQHLVYLKTRALEATVALADHWDHSIILNEAVKEEITFWISYLETNCSKSRFLSRQPPAYLVWSDASSFASGGVVMSLSGTAPALQVHCPFTAAESVQSSAWRELKAVMTVLQSVGSRLSDCSVRWFTDAKNVVSILRKGSMKPHLNSIASDIFSVSADLGIDFEITWVPRDANVLADFLSKIPDYDDWCISDSLLSLLQSRWGPITCDCFANSINAKHLKFYSPFACPGSSGVGAFNFSWSYDRNLLVPPLSLIPQTVFYLGNCKAAGYLLVPSWPSQPYWPLLMSTFVGKFTREKLVFSAKDAIRPGRFNRTFDPAICTSAFVALFLDYRDA